MMECLYCKGNMEKGYAPFHLDQNGYHIQWDQVPAWVCVQCGEPYFESPQVTLIQKAVMALEREAHELLQKSA